MGYLADIAVSGVAVAGPLVLLALFTLPMFQRPRWDQWPILLALVMGGWGSLILLCVVVWHDYRQDR